MNNFRLQSTFFKVFILISIILLAKISVSQNRIYAQSIIDTLASKSFYGRGYVKNGDRKAAEFIAEQYSALGLKSIDNTVFLYDYTFPIVVYEKNIKVKIGKHKLKPGKDFIVTPGCYSINKRLKISEIKNSDNYPSKKRRALLYDTSFRFDKNHLNQSEKYKLRITLQKKLTWSVTTNFDEVAGIEILKTSLPENHKKIKIKVKSKIKIHTAANVIGYIEGSKIKDTFIVITAHYDHLGMMGNVIFPGANDNASGTSMMLDLAAYFVKNPPKYSIAFMAFSGEEAGLIGSKHYTDNPLEKLPLTKIKFLVNLDLMGSGEKGMAVVNATVFPDYFSKLQNINNEKKYLSGFKVRGKAANSDHYWFTERGVKCFFFYLMGNYSHYHDIFDTPQNLKLGEYYNKSFLLIKDFILAI